MNHPLVSIIMPIYKVADCITPSLESALNQTYSHIEYILVNDCTPDESMEVIDGIIRRDIYKDKKIRILNLESNGGLSNARNEGLRIAEGEYIFFMDSDDMISDNCIELHLKSLVESSADFSDGNVTIVGVNHNMFKPYESLCLIDTNLLENYFRILHVCGWNKLIRRELLISNQIYFEKGMLYEDNLWCYQLCKCANKYVTVPYNTYFYLIRPGSITTQRGNVPHARKQFNSFILLLELLTKEFQNPTNKILRKFQRKWLNLMLLKIKTRLITSPLGNIEQKEIYDKLLPFGKRLPVYSRVIQQVPYSLFKFIFLVPNFIFRTIRQ